MEENSDAVRPVAGPTYRQRLTVTGGVGLIASLAGPFWAGIVWANIESGGYNTPSPLWLIPGILLSWVAFPLLLIGREHYDATRQIADEAQRSSANTMHPENYRAVLPSAKRPVGQDARKVPEDWP